MMNLELWLEDTLYNEYKTFTSTKSDIEYHKLPNSKSFAMSCQLAAKNSKADWLVFFAKNVVCDEKLIQAISVLQSTITQAPIDIGVFELRQLPLEAGHHIDPITLDTTTIECEAFAVRRSVWEISGGLDKNFDLHLGFEFATRVIATGYKLKYLPTACVNVTNNRNRLALNTLEDYSAYWKEKLLFEAKYGSISSLTAKKFEYFQEIKSPKHFPSVRKVLVKNLFTLLGVGFSEYFWRNKNKSLYKNINKSGYNPDSVPQRGRYTQFPLQNTELPLVSVVIRTCSRPAVLAETLKCLYHQTYTNFEIVLIEDGEPTAQEMVKNDFSDLPIQYFSTGKNVGRGRAGNIGIEKSNGRYVCFLDDDDFYYPDYIESSVAYLLSESDLDFIYTSIMALEINVEQRNPDYKYTIVNRFPVIFEHINLMDMCVKCRVPISGGMFKRELYDKIGGMREDIDADEDWAMWLRYSMIGKRKQPNLVDIPRATGLCVYPADKTLAQARHTAYEKFDYQMLSDENLRFNVTRADISGWKEQLLKDVAHLKSIGQLESILNGRNKWIRYTPVLPENDTDTIELTAMQINGYYQTILDDISAN